MALTPSGDKDLHHKVVRLIEEAKRVSESDKKEGHHVYGFTLSFGPEGAPSIDEFGNSPPTPTDVFLEPPTEVVEDQDTVTVYFEIPGARKEDIDLRVGVESISLTVDSGIRRYLKEVKLSSKVDVKSSRADLNKDVLQVVLNRIGNSKAGQRIRIN